MVKKFNKEYIDMVSKKAIDKMKSCLTSDVEFSEHDLESTKIMVEPDYPHGDRYVLRMPVENYHILGKRHGKLIKQECLKSGKVTSPRANDEVFEMDLEDLESEDVWGPNSKKHKVHVTISLE